MPLDETPGHRERPAPKKWWAVINDKTGLTIELAMDVTGRNLQRIMIFADQGDAEHVCAFFRGRYPSMNFKVQAVAPLITEF